MLKAANIKCDQKLPSLFFFTDRKKFKDIFQIIKALPKGSAVIIREYDLNYQERLAFALKVKEIARQKNLLFFIAKNLQLALQIKADGVHFTDFDPSWIKYLRYQRMNKNNFLFACCVHKESNLRKAEKLGMDVIFYSPIFKTNSHKERKEIGIFNFRKASLKSKKPIYALGGINEENIKSLKSCNIAGIGGISLFARAD